MNKEYRLAFVNEKLELSWFKLSHGGIAEIAPGELGDLLVGGIQNVLILPSLCGLPFQVELLFDDLQKVKRVIPQCVADIYAEVDENWLYSWNLTEISKDSENKKFVVSGVAFPPEFSPNKLLPDCDVRLAIPDLSLVEMSAKGAVELNTPVSKLTAIFSDSGIISRIISEASVAIPPILAFSGIEKVQNIDLIQDHPGLLERINAIADKADFIDVSGFQQKRTSKSLKVTALAMAVLVIGLILSWHFFLWFQCELSENAAFRTKKYMNAAFVKVFPNVPMIDAVSQIKKKIADAEKNIQEAGAVPSLPWLELLGLVSSTNSENITFQKVSSNKDSFRLQGSAADYSSLEKLKARIEKMPVVGVVAIPESRKALNKVSFTLEAKWKN